MQSYSTILGVIELRLEKVSYATTQKRYRIGSSTITLIMNRFQELGLTLDERKYSNMSTQTKEKSLLFSRDGVFCKIWRHTEFRTFFSCFYSFPEPRVTMGAERQGIYDSCHPRAAG